MTLSGQDIQLQMILISHDIELKRRRLQRTELEWPDESDIFIETRKLIHEVFELPACEWSTPRAYLLLPDVHDAVIHLATEEFDRLPNIPS